MPLRTKTLGTILVSFAPTRQHFI